VTNTKKILLTLILVLPFSALFAQTSFSGSYTVDTAKINFGRAPHWVLPVSFKVDQQGANVTITRTTVDAQGSPSSFTEQLHPGDSTQTNIHGNLVRKASISWNADQSSFTIVYVTQDQGGTPLNRVKETWTLEDGGKTLVLDRFVEQTNGLKYPIKGYYDRQ